MSSSVVTLLTKWILDGLMDDEKKSVMLWMVSGDDVAVNYYNPRSVGKAWNILRWFAENKGLERSVSTGSDLSEFVRESLDACIDLALKEGFVQEMERSLTEDQ